MYHKKNSNTEHLLADTFMVLFFSIFSLGIYTIFWIYLKNKEFEKMDKFAPDSLRGLIVMTIIPFSWYFIFSILKLFIFSFENVILNFIEVFFFIFILLLIIKYLFDFCVSFGEVTNTIGILWFSLFFFGIIGILGIYLKILYMSFFVVFFIAAVTIMQTELNIHHNMLMSKKKGHI